MTGYASSITKRLFDLSVALSALLLLSPLMLAVAVAIAVFVGLPVLFRQQRTGFAGRIFTLNKFRTMAGNPPPEGSGSDAARLTPFGAWLRRLSLDELPQLWNVIAGEMSVVGPRPLLAAYENRYSPFQRRRHEVKPGITGWAQVNGRNAISWERKFELDVWYVDHCSLWLDLKIALLTAYSLISRKGVSHGDHATMPLFQPQQDGGQPAPACSENGNGQ